MAAAAASLGIVYAACSATTSYEVLSFFFDGVPDPSKPVVEDVYGPPPPPRPSPLDPRRSPSAAVFYVHKPYLERACTECHIDRSGGERRLVLQLDAMKALRAPVEQLCIRCHQPPEARYQHAPAQLGLCVSCHHPHQSQYPSLLLAERVSTLCLTCHVDDTWPSRELHDAWADQDCGVCHDPHASDDPYFRRAGWEAALRVPSNDFGPQPEAAPGDRR